MKIYKTILTTDVFLDKRPDMASFETESIQSAINQSYTLLDSECNGFLTTVWEFNTSNLDDEGNDNGTTIDSTSEYYRTNWELSQAVEAMIAQTQYSLNLGNDYSKGSESFSIGGVNGSFTRGADTKVIAPTVLKLLQNARIYNLQSFTMNNNKINQNGERIYDNPYEQEPITRSIGDRRYVNMDQPNAKAGNVLYINNNHFVDFGSPTEVGITTYNTNNIFDPKTGNYVPIDKVDSLLFLGQDLYGHNSGMTRGEIYNLVVNTNQNWREDYFYTKDTIIPYAFHDSDGKWFLKDFLALADNKGKNPLTYSVEPSAKNNYQEKIWQDLGTVEVDINELVQLVYDRVDEKYSLVWSNYQELFEAKYSAFVEEVNNNFATLQETFENRFNEKEQEHETKFQEKEQEHEAQFTELKNSINEPIEKLREDVDNHETRITDLEQPKIKVSCTFGYEITEESYNARRYYSEGNYNLSLPEEVLDSSKTFVATMYFANKDTIKNMKTYYGTYTFTYQYNQTDKLFQIANAYQIRENGGTWEYEQFDQFRIILKQGVLVRVDTWSKNNVVALFKIEFKEI